jgi:hypothetical protein
VLHSGRNSGGLTVLESRWVVKDGHVVIFILVASALIVFAGETGVRRGANTQKSLAIEAGVAEYTIDPKTGETSFVYKTCK